MDDYGIWEALKSVIYNHTVVITFKQESTGFRRHLRCTKADEFIPVNQRAENVGAPDGFLKVWSKSLNLWMSVRRGSIESFNPILPSDFATLSEYRHHSGL